MSKQKNYDVVKENEIGYLKAEIFNSLFVSGRIFEINHDKKINNIFKVLFV